MDSVDQFKEELLQGEKASLIKKVSKQNKTLKKRFDEEVLSKQNAEIALKQQYKPITDIQGEQITKMDTLLQQLLTDLQGKHDITSTLLADVIRGLANSNETIRKQGLDIVSAIAKQPLLSDSINELNNYPNLVKKITQSEGIGLRDLTDQDRKALEPLSHLSDNDLRTLVNYYVLQGKIKTDLSSDEEDLGAVGLPTYTESVFQENPAGNHKYKEVMTSLKKRKAGLNKEVKHGEPTVSPIFYYEANEPDTVKFGNYNVLFKEDKIKVADKEYTLTAGLELLLNRVNPTLNERITDEDLNNYLNITLDAGFDYRNHTSVGKKLHEVLAKLGRLNELQKGVQVVGYGYNKIILPDNVSELKKRLTLLLGEYKAGNKSMFNEINAVLDILLKKGAISKAQFKAVLHEINGT